MEEKKKVIYILGPFDSESGLADYAAVDDMLTSLGYETISSALIPAGMDKTKAHFIAAAMIDAADAVVVLPDWQTSGDAVAEHHLAYGFGKSGPYIPAGYYDKLPRDTAMECLKYDMERALGEVSA